MKRYLSDNIAKDCARKMVLLSGPRQVGKTTLANSLPFSPSTYLNFDAEEDRDTINRKIWPRESKLVILDELHKKKNWKRWLKGVFDTESYPPYLIVTGSARLDIYRKGGDSLAGRYFPFRLHPLSVAELSEVESSRESLEKLLILGGFPEPYLSGSEVDAKRWRRTHVERILREDILALEQIRDLRSVEFLVDLLSRQVGSLISYDSLARDLEVSPHSIKRWIEILESMYVIFRVTPYAKKVKRGIKKQPKVYFYDTGYVRGDNASRLENLVATALLKYTHFREDVFGERRALHFVRNRNRQEVDFCLVCEDSVEQLVEVKQSATDTRQLNYFHQQLQPQKRSVLLVYDLGRSRSLESVDILRADEWLRELV